MVGFAMLIEANNIQLNCELSGIADGQTVVLSHVIGSSLIMWNPQMHVLNERYRVLRYDTRGMGLSSAPDESYSMEMLVADAVALLDAWQLEQVHWVGLSLGAMIGMGLAIHHPERLCSLVLLDTFATPSEQARQLFESRVTASSMESMVDSALGIWFTESFRNSRSREIELNRSQFLATSLAGYIGNCHAIMNLDYLDQLDRIRAPTSLIVGEFDRATPPGDSMAISERIAGSQVHLIKDAAHLCNVEQPAQVNAVLMNFLDQF